MKKLLLLSLIALGCEKEKFNCYTCNMNTTTNYHSRFTTFRNCGKSQRAVELRHTKFYDGRGNETRVKCYADR